MFHFNLECVISALNVALVVWCNHNYGNCCVIRGLERRKRRIYLPKIYNTYKPNPTAEPNPAHVESSGRGKAHLDFLKPTRWFGVKIVPPRMPHGMSECLAGPSIKPLDQIWWNWAVLVVWEFACPQSGPKYKVALRMDFPCRSFAH